MRRTLTGVTLLLVLSMSVSTSAAPPAPATIAAAVKAARCKLVRVASGPTDLGGYLVARRTATDPRPLVPTTASLVLESTGPLVTAKELKNLTLAMRDALDASLDLPEFVQLTVDLYAEDRLRQPTSWHLQGVGLHREPKMVGEATKFLLRERARDTTDPVEWYARVVWWKPYRVAEGGRYGGAEGWQFDAWYAPANTSPRPAEGGSDNAPEKVK